MVLRLNQMQSPEMAKALRGLHAKYGRYAIPVVELRKMLDEAMGERTLGQELNAMREGRCFVCADAKLAAASDGSGVETINPEAADSETELRRLRRT